MTKMKKNLTYTELSSVTYVSPDGLVTTYRQEDSSFEKGEIRHEARRVELWSNNSHQVIVLLTNNLELDVKTLRRFTSEDGL